MTCIKTGAVVHFPEYDVTVAADLYVVDGVTIVRFLPSQWDCDNCREVTHVAYTEGGFWRRDLGVLVASSLYGGVEEVES
jgi:hypothetical protein